MTPEELNAMTTDDMFDYLELNTDEGCAAVLGALKERYFLTSSAAKLWFAHAARDIEREQRRLDRVAVRQEHNL